MSQAERESSGAVGEEIALERISASNLNPLIGDDAMGTAELCANAVNFLADAADSIDHNSGLGGKGEALHYLLRGVAHALSYEFLQRESAKKEALQ